MLFLFAVLAALLLALFLGADHVVRRFQHTARSRRILTLEAGVSLLAAGWSLANIGLGPGFKYILIPVVAGALFVVQAFATVELWRRHKHRSVYRELAVLRRQKHRMQQTVDRLRWEMEGLRRARGDAGLGSASPSPAWVSDSDRRLADLAQRLARCQGEITLINQRLGEWESKNTDLKARKLVLD